MADGAVRGGLTRKWRGRYGEGGYCISQAGQGAHRTKLAQMLADCAFCPVCFWGRAITLGMAKDRWVVYERSDNGQFIQMSRFFTSRARAEKERDKLLAGFHSKKVSLGVGRCP